MKINIGSGLKPFLGYINIDKSKKAKPELLLDLEKGKIPYKDNSIEEIIAYNILEHIDNIIPLMNECYRILKKDGKMIITVPQGDGIWADPTHKRAFSKLSFRYYCGYPLSEIYGIKCKFNLIENEFKDNEDGGILWIVLQK